MNSVFITGGSSGIGAALTTLAARAGWRVFFTYRDRPRANALLQTLSGLPVEALALDLAAPDAIAAGLTQVAQSTDRLDAVVLAAAPPPELTPLWKQSVAALQEQFAVQVLGHQQLLAACWKTFFSQQASSHVVAVLSAAAGSPPWGQMGSYVIAKRGLQALLECALVDYGRMGLRASVVVPTYTETPMLTSLNRHLVEAARLKQPAGRFLRPEEVAARVLQCLNACPAEPLLNWQPVEAVAR